MAMREIPTPETLRQLLRYEPETGKLFWLPRPRSMFALQRFHRHWNTVYAGREAFTSTVKNGYRTSSVNNLTLYAHRVAWAIHYGRWPSKHIDHINGNPTDNRIVNLRDCDAAENMKNQRKNKRNTSGETGVSWDKNGKRWVAGIRCGGKTKYLGWSESFDEAVAIRRRAAATLGFTDRHGT